MGEFFSNIGNAVRRVASNVSTEVSVAAQEQKIKDAYLTLGRMHYQAVQLGDAPTGETFDAQIAKIQEMFANIDEARRNQKVSVEDFEDVT